MMAFGTKSCRKVHKIAGPGNAFVTAAKRQVYGYVAIDQVAGPSEIAVLADGTVDHTGYICADVSGKLEVGGKAAVGITIDSTDAGYEWAQLGVDEWMQNPAGDYIFMPKQQRNQSFVINGGNVYDLVDIYKANGDEMGGTLVIKAIACSHSYGDADEDGAVTSADALAVLRTTVMLDSMDQIHLDMCDVDKDGFLTAADALMILRRSTGLIGEF